VALILAQPNIMFFIAWNEFQCIHPFRFKTQQGHILQCELGVEKWVQAWRLKQGGN